MWNSRAYIGAPLPELEQLMAGAPQVSHEIALSSTPVRGWRCSTTAKTGATAAAAAAAAAGGVQRQLPQQRPYYSKHGAQEYPAAAAESRPSKRHCLALQDKVAPAAQQLNPHPSSSKAHGILHEPFFHTGAVLQLEGDWRPKLQQRAYRQRQPSNQLCFDLIVCSSDDETSTDVIDLTDESVTTSLAGTAAVDPSTPGTGCVAYCQRAAPAIRCSSYSEARHEVAKPLQAAPTAAVAAGSRTRVTAMKLVVDTKEVMRKKTPDDLYLSVCGAVDRQLQHGLPHFTTVDVVQEVLPLGDYMWLLHEDTNSNSQGAAAATAAATNALSACVVAGAVVERKTGRDIVARSSDGDHLRQLQRMYHLCNWLPHQLLIIETPTQHINICGTTVNHIRKLPQTSTAIHDTCTLFDFILRAALSPHGTSQKVLLAPAVEDTRSILLAVTQLLVHGVHSRRGLQSPQQHTYTGRMTYGELRSRVNEWDRRPKDPLPVELTAPRVATDMPNQPAIDTVFQVTHGVEDFDGLTLYRHTQNQHLQIVHVTGEKLLILFDSLYVQSTTALHVNPEASLSTLEAVDVALHIGALLASTLEAFIDQTATTADSGSGSKGYHRHILLVENLFGGAGNGALARMDKDQANAAEGKKPVDKKAAQRQANMATLHGVALKNHSWLWLVCFVLIQDWHVMLCQSRKSVAQFLEVAVSKCSSLQ